YGFGNLSVAIVRDARQALHEGKIVAVKGLGGFLFACDAQNDESVRLLRQRKKRSDKPFALMSRDIASVESFCTVGNDDRASLLSSRRPIVILERRNDTRISEMIAPGNNA